MTASVPLPPGWTAGADRRLLDGPGGVRVTAVKAGDGWRFLAWGPDRSAGWDYRAWRDGRAPHWSGEEPAVHYPRGHSIPQPALLLGCFATAAEARAACGYPDP